MGDGQRRHRAVQRPELPGQVVLVLQGGGALGAYQAGVYEAMHEAGVEPDWVIGTSIGAINAALIAGNTPEQRLERLRTFWSRVEQRCGDELCDSSPGLRTCRPTCDDHARHPGVLRAESACVARPARAARRRSARLLHDVAAA